MVVEGSDLAHPQIAVGAPGLSAGRTRSDLALSPLGQSPGPGCIHSCHLWEKGWRLLEVAGGQEDEGGEACGLDVPPLLSFSRCCKKAEL